MEQEVQDLKDLPLESLISAPLNAVIAAQANAAMSTANFIQQIGFVNKGDKKKSIFDRLNPGATTNPDKFDVRTAELVFVKKEKIEPPPTSGATTKDVEERVSLPFITLFNIPSVEIGEMTWAFSVKLKRIEDFETELTHSTTTTTTGGGSAEIGLASLGIPISIGASMKVESTSKTDFDLRYGLGRDHEYNLNITVKANAAAPPKGIERLLGIAERIAAANEAAVKP